VRILLLGNIAGFAATLILSGDAVQFAPQFARLAVVLEPVLLLSLVSLYALSKWLARLPYAWGVAIVMLLVRGGADADPARCWAGNARPGAGMRACLRRSDRYFAWRSARSLPP
jgi:hypothetical protein